MTDRKNLNDFFSALSGELKKKKTTDDEAQLKEQLFQEEMLRRSRLQEATKLEEARKEAERERVRLEEERTRLEEERIKLLEEQENKMNDGLLETQRIVEAEDIPSKQVAMLRQEIDAVRTMTVKSLESMSTMGGSGEVLFSRLDDVNINFNTIAPGEAIVWDGNSFTSTLITSGPDILNNTGIVAESPTKIKFTGDATVTYDSVNDIAIVNVAAGAGSSYTLNWKDEGNLIAVDPLNINFTGIGTATYNVSTNTVTLNIPNTNVDTHVNVQNAAGTVVTPNASAIRFAGDLTVINQAGVAVVSYTTPIIPTTQYFDEAIALVTDPAKISFTGIASASYNAGTGILTVNIPDTNTDTDTHVDVQNAGGTVVTNADAIKFIGDLTVVNEAGVAVVSYTTPVFNDTDTHVNVLDATTTVAVSPDAIKFIGDVGVTYDSGTNTAIVNVIGGGGGGSTTNWKEEGLTIATNPLNVNFIGIATATYDGGTNTVNIDIPDTNTDTHVDIEDQNGLVITSAAAIRFLGDLQVTTDNNIAIVTYNTPATNSITYQEEGVAVAVNPLNINFTGIGTASFVGDTLTINIPDTNTDVDTRINVEDELGVIALGPTNIRFTGDTSVSYEVGTDTVVVDTVFPTFPTIPTTTYQEEGVDLTTDPLRINFTGIATASYNGGTGVLTVDIPNTDTDTHVDVANGGGVVVPNADAIRFTGDLTVTSDGTTAVVNYNTPAAPTIPTTTYKDEGATLVTDPLNINFTGTGVTSSFAGDTLTVNIPTPTIPTTTYKDEGTTLVTDPLNINYTGNVVASFAGDTLTVNVPTTITTYKDEGTTVVANPPNINYTGNVTASFTGDTLTVNVPSTAPSVSNAGGTVVNQATDIKFTGAGVTVTANGSQAVVDINTSTVAPPIGSMLPWLASLTGVPVLPAGWLVANGQTVNDVASPLNGTVLPNMSGMFIRGNNTTSGATGGAATHTHTYTPASETAGNPDLAGTKNVAADVQATTDPASSLPPYYEVVYIIRVK